MTDNQAPSGLPTQAVHESYLQMQRALTAYRRAKDRGSDQEQARAHGEVQDGVLAFYEMLRPYIKRRNLRKDYWRGEAPPYPDADGGQPDPDDGVAVLEVQRNVNPHSIAGLDLEEGWDYEYLHKELGLGRDVRIIGHMVEGDTVLVATHSYVTGLKHLDNWETQFQETTEDIGGFLAGSQEQTRTRQRVAIEKLTRAARELSDAGDELGLLARVDESRPKNHLSSNP